MEFFNKKEEVVDIKLTQFGRDLLARGAFKPVFYQFFDGDILYNSSLAGFSEHQNDAESRILEDTPKLKVQTLPLSVEERYAKEQQMIDEGQREVFVTIDREAEPRIQDRILLYPLGSHEIANQSSPAFSLRALATPMESGVGDLKIVESGILKNIPQIDITASFTLSEDRTELLEEPTMVNKESFFDLSSRQTTFADGSKIKVEGLPITLDLEEFNVFFGLDNFELELYEITEKDDDEILTRIKDLTKINELFHIKTDASVEEVEAKTGRKSNYYRSRER